MKKILIYFFSIMLIFSLSSCGLGKLLDLGAPLEQTNQFRDFSLRYGSEDRRSYKQVVYFDDLDLEELQKSGYKLKATITYDEYYTKQWKLPVDYNGAPKYSVSIVDANDNGGKVTDLEAGLNKATKELTMTLRMADLVDREIYLLIETDNFQNEIFFKNITVHFECIR